MMKDLMKTLFAVDKKAAITHMNICKNSRKWFQRAEIIIFFKNWPIFNFMNDGL